MDLDQRNQWMNGAKNLKGHPDRISITPDLPPVIRHMKKELIDERKKKLPTGTKSSLKYLNSWPYLQLSIQGRNPIYSKVTEDEIATQLISCDLNTAFICER